MTIPDDGYADGGCAYTEEEIAIIDGTPIDVLCGCGWGRLNCPIDELPIQCPVCGYEFNPNDEE